MNTTIPPAPRASLPLKIMIAAGAVGFAVLLGLRVRDKTQSQAAIGREREATAQRAAASSGQAPSVVVVRGEAQTWRPTVSLEGTLQPWHEADLGFKAGGRLATVRVKVGDQVKAGAVLATLDASEAGAQVRAARAQVRAAETQAELARDAERRTQELVKAGAMGEATGTQAKGQLDLGVAQLEAARAQVALASVAVSNHTMTAPFAGLVTRAPTGPGSVVGAGMPLVHLQDTSRLRLVATVSEADASLVQPGSVVAIEREGKAVEGKVLTVLRSVDAATRRVPLEAEIPNDPSLLTGAFVRATIRAGDAVPVLRLPATARRPGSQDEVVVVSGGKLAVRRVVFASAPDGALLVRSGLGAQDDVVAAPASEVKEGQAVTTRTGEAAAPASSGSAAPKEMAR